MEEEVDVVPSPNHNLIFLAKRIEEKVSRKWICKLLLKRPLFCHCATTDKFNMLIRSPSLSVATHSGLKYNLHCIYTGFIPVNLISSQLSAPVSQSDDDQHTVGM